MILLRLEFALVYHIGKMLVDQRHLFEDEYVFGVDEDFVKFMTDQRKMSDDADSLQEKRID